MEWLTQKNITNIEICILDCERRPMVSQVGGNSVQMGKGSGTEGNLQRSICSRGDCNQHRGPASPLPHSCKQVRQNLWDSGSPGAQSFSVDVSAGLAYTAMAPVQVQVKPLACARDRKCWIGLYCNGTSSSSGRALCLCMRKKMLG
jgi:hypothetical protein